MNERTDYEIMKCVAGHTIQFSVNGTIVSLECSCGRVFDREVTPLPRDGMKLIRTRSLIRAELHLEQSKERVAA